MTDQVRVRFAPSPTGSPHIGSVRTAIYDWLYARHTGGKFILRIEDTDRARFVPGSTEEIMESLRWLGIEIDEGPGHDGPCGPYFQTERLGIYQQHAEQLLANGQAYHCFCTSERLDEMRKAQEAAKLPTGYDRLCLQLTPEEAASKLEEGTPAVIRFKVPQEGTTTFHDIVRGDITFENRLIDDFIIMKSDGYPTYQFASVVDDHLMEITHVIRGEEWISSTPKHFLEYQAFGWEMPKFAHAPLLVGPDRAKLGKRHGSVKFVDFIEQGFVREAIINFVTLLGWTPGTDEEVFSVDELIERFTLEGIVNHPVVFDREKMEWMNGVYIRAMEIGKLADLCLPYLQKAGLVPDNPSPEHMDYVRRVIAIEQERIKLLSEVVALTDFFFLDEPPYEEKGVNKWLRRDYVPDLLTRLIEALGGTVGEAFNGLPSQETRVSTHREAVEGLPYGPEAIEECVRKIGEEIGQTGGAIIHPIRMAVTGRTVGPGLFETISVLGRDRVLFRLRRTLELLQTS